MSTVVESENVNKSVLYVIRLKDDQGKKEYHDCLDRMDSEESHNDVPGM